MYHPNVRWSMGWCGVALGGALCLGGCASSGQSMVPTPARQHALQVETAGAALYAQGNYRGARAQFVEALRLQQSLDDSTAVARNLLHQARAELAQGLATDALEHATQVQDASLQSQALLLQAQAYLALNQLVLAQQQLDHWLTLCTADCPYRGSAYVLLARVAWARADAPSTVLHAEQALRVSDDSHDAHEFANAWRLLAQAKSAMGDYAGALAAVEAALNTDRKLALPEKMARDWLLTGDIYRQAGSPQATSAYQRAAAIARAAGLTDMAQRATQALQEKTP